MNEKANRMARKRTRRSRPRELSDTELLASAWRELAGKSGITPTKSSSTRTAPFSARRRGLCEQGGRWINRGDDVRFHRDFSGVVHDGCKPPPITVGGVAKPVVIGKREAPTVCLECHLMHAGQCW